jgi:hypothetical protein
MPGCSGGRLSEARGVWGAGNLEGEGWGRGWVKGGQFTSNLRTSGRILSQLGGFQVSERGLERGANGR